MNTPISSSTQAPTTALAIDASKPLVQQQWFIDARIFSQQLLHAQTKDRFKLARLRSSLLKINTADNTLATKHDALVEQWLNLFIRSCECVAKRESSVPEISYPEQLPVSAKREDIKALIKTNQVVIVAGETGSGKTTQLPKMCLELGFGRQGLIGHTQPRRVAATAVARRISEELKCPLGEQVGYQVRFSDNTKEESLVKLMTDGVLLAEIAHDRFLERYDCIIIDEAHERSLNIDFLLGYVKRVIAKRPDFRVIITSATIDTERFSKHFDNAPIVSVEGRSFPVEMVYQPIEELSADCVIEHAVEQVLMVIDDDEQEGGVQERGDVLVFLPGEGEIRQISKHLRHSTIDGLEVLPLYARLSAKDQQKILTANPSNLIRRVVLATNVAETSLTVPGIRYVIDSGLARVSRYSHRSKVQQLPIEKISQAAANQRAGRCGRVSAGVCFRLYSNDDFNQRDAFTQPEIQRTNLSQVILQMQTLRIGDVGEFPFLDAPDKRLVNDGFKQLFELGAVDAKRNVTTLGKQVSRLPIDPQLARIVIQAEKESSLQEVMIIVAALAMQDPREYPADKREAAQQKHSIYKDTESDFIAILNMWHYCEEQRQNVSHNQFRRWCLKNFLSHQRLHEWRELHRQILSLVRSMKLKINSQKSDLHGIHRALLSGFITQVGFQEEPRLYAGTRNRQFRIFPNSYTGRKPPKWIMTGQLLETSQLFAHKVGKIEPQWVEEIASHLLKYNYLEPHFSSKQGQVLVWQTASLYGLLVAEKKRVSYSQIDPAAARELFIKEGLVAELLHSNAPFYQHNKALRKELERLEEKTRRRDLMVSDDVIYDFYNKLLPSDVANFHSLEKWRKQAEKTSPKLLFADKSLFIQTALSGAEGEAFPDSLEWQGVLYPLKYTFQPGQIDDGVTVFVPVESLNRVPKFLFEWLVPGLLLEKCEALLKCLPKALRKKIVPIPDTLQKIMPLLSRTDEPLVTALAKALKRTHNMNISHDDWQLDRLDDYYKITITLLDEHQKPEKNTKGGKVIVKAKAANNTPDVSHVLEQSKDLALLIKKHGDKVQQRLNQQLDTEEKGNKEYTRWDFNDVQKEQMVKTAGTHLKSFPAIEDIGHAVKLSLT
ncbi:MAG: ATP-dependent RNA helicase HrpA, partial [Sinobacterium sp.]|nr:ATP-dependent RNA helicase HrpA [Sinobacterium sp.]